MGAILSSDYDVPVDPETGMPVPQKPIDGWRRAALDGKLGSYLIDQLRGAAPAVKEAMPKGAYGWATMPARATVALAKGVGNEFMDLVRRSQDAQQSGDINEMADVGFDTAKDMIGGGIGLSHFVGPTGTVLGAGVKARKGQALAEALRNGDKLTKEERALSLLGRYPTSTAGRIVNQTAENGGYTVNLPTGNVPTDGLMMGKYANTDPRNIVVEGRPLSQADIRASVLRNAPALGKNENHIGTWRNPEDGKTYVDISQRFNPDEIRKATKYGERTGQLAGYDVGKGETFPVGNWKEWIQGPEYHARMDEMAQLGREYLSQHPANEWWDMHGSSFERVYGPENLRQVAGFTASTAPNTAPYPNLQTMSEYMRRYLRGEPIVQPDWRVPEGAMSRQAGKKIGMEAGRAANLRKSAAGDLDALRKDKVREEAKALMGDPDAVVLDRHQARLAEKPEAGIYADVQEGVVKGPAYAPLKQQFLIAAKRSGRDARDYSADVWTGIRETIKNTDQLYGQPFKGSSIVGESKSYADIFDDVIRDKAKHMKITVEELEKRLRSGDADLLSAVLSAPAAYAAYQQMTGVAPAGQAPQ